MTSRLPTEARLNDARQAMSARAGRRRIRALTDRAGLPAMLAIGGLIPVLTNGTPMGSAPVLRMPSRIVCSGSGPVRRPRLRQLRLRRPRRGASYWRMSPGDQCTNYAAYVESTVYHVRQPSVPARQRRPVGCHRRRARRAWSTTRPSVGAVAEWNGGTFGIGPVGHVGVVEAVGPHDSYIVISQQHMGGVRNDYDWTLIKAHRPADEWQTWPSHFIHFRIPRRADVGYFNPRPAQFAVRYSQTAGRRTAPATLGIPRRRCRWSATGAAGADDTGYYNPQVRHVPPDRRAGAHGTGAIKATFGPAHMIPLVGDWTGHGQGRHRLLRPEDRDVLPAPDAAVRAGSCKFTFGQPRHDPAGRRLERQRQGRRRLLQPAGPASSTLRNELRHGPAWASFRFGPPHMIPVVGNWTGVGRQDGVGYYNPRTGTFYLRDRLDAGAAPTRSIRFGPRHMIPLTGEWFGG